jgi:hypothetical protein
MSYLEELQISEAARAGRYGEALQLQEALAVKVEEEETKREGKPAKETRRRSMKWHGMPCLHENSRKL